MSAAWCFEDQGTPYTEAVLEAVRRGARVIVPPIWKLEVVNALVVAERRKIIDAAKLTRFVGDLGKIEIEIDAAGLDQVFVTTLELARKYHRSSYDASYLELARRRSLPLATKDGSLRKAAAGIGLEIFDPR